MFYLKFYLRFASKIEKFKILGEENIAFFDEEMMITNLFNLLEYITDDYLHIILDAFTYLSKVKYEFKNIILKNDFFNI